MGEWPSGEVEWMGQSAKEIKVGEDTEKEVCKAAQALASNLDSIIGMQK